MPTQNKAKIAKMTLDELLEEATGGDPQLKMELKHLVFHFVQIYLSKRK